MTDIQQLRTHLNRLRLLKTWQLVILLIIAAFLSATLLKVNNIGMMQRREAVLTSDKTADVIQVRARLQALQHYSATHMNANTGPFYLQGQYDADVKKTIAAANAQASRGGNVLSQADAICRPRFSSYSIAYTLCVADEQAKLPPSQAPHDTITLPNPNLYRYDFISPRWSPDAAGFSVLLCLFITGVIIFRLVLLVAFKLLIKHYYRGT